MSTPPRTEPGTYALLLASSGNETVRIGSLGRMSLRSGFYVYAGSALGPGGLSARIAHHAAVSPNPHWHVDYLRARTRLERVWYAYGPTRCECRWAAALKALSGAPAPLRRFGASDCACESHLYFFADPPPRSKFQQILRAVESQLRPGV